MHLQIRVQTQVTSVLYYQLMLLQSGKKEVKINLKDKKQIEYKQGRQLRQTIPESLSCVFRHAAVRDWLSIRKS